MCRRANHALIKMNPQQLGIDELVNLQTKKEVMLLDIRDEASFLQGHIPGAIHATREFFNTLLGSGQRDQTIVVCCYHGISSEMVARQLIDHGFPDVYNLSGGFAGWQGAAS